MSTQATVNYLKTSPKTLQHTCIQYCKKVQCSTFFYAFVWVLPIHWSHHRHQIHSQKHIFIPELAHNLSRTSATLILLVTTPFMTKKCKQFQMVFRRESTFDTFKMAWVSVRFSWLTKCLTLNHTFWVLQKFNTCIFNVLLSMYVMLQSL